MPNLCALSHRYNATTKELHALEDEALGGSGRAGGAAVACSEYIGDPCDGTMAAADFDQRTDDRTDHIVQEGISGNIEDNQALPRLDRHVHGHIREVARGRPSVSYK